MTLYNTVEKFESSFEFNRLTPFVPECIFSDNRINFLDLLSKSILRSKLARPYPDLITFGYYCRRSNIEKLKSQQLSDGNNRYKFGKGVCVHITPSNIPMNFAFSFLMGFLSGNLNIVRLPSKDFEQVDVFLNLFMSLLDKVEFSNIYSTNYFIRSERDCNKLNNIIKTSDALVVWGGDESVDTFRGLKKKPSCVEAYFPDRVSSVVINCDEFLELTDEDCRKFCMNFYNDTYVVDQNACSSPSKIYWYSKSERWSLAKQKFQNFLNEYLTVNYELKTISKIDKLVDLMHFCDLNQAPIKVTKDSDLLWLIEADNKNLKPKLGTFLTIDVSTLYEVAKGIRETEQTLLYFGFNPEDILKNISKSGALVDRIVPVGQALDIGLQWDGKNMIDVLSRKVQVI